jgi:D-alanine transaminase
MSNVYLNGQFLPQQQAMIPVMDRGFLFGDGVYEVIPVYGKRLFRLPEHLQRLDRSLTAIGITNPHDEAGWQAILEELIAGVPGDELSVYLQVTRGTGSSRDHAISDDLVPTVFATASTTKPPPVEYQQQGIRCITTEDIRWSRCDIKAITLLPAVLLRQQAGEADVQETLLVRDGQVSEGSISNVFMVRDETLITPPNSRRLLPGVTRGLVLELAANAGMKVKQRPIPVAELFDADELWISGSSREIQAVVEVDARTIGDGRPGPQYRRMMALYSDFKTHFQEDR